MKIYYQSKLKPYSRNLRNKSTLSEVLLWNKLKARQMMGYQFMRQKPIENYIVDFFCSKLKLIIEVDGSSHHGKAEYDLQRQKKLEALGLNVLRIDDMDVKMEMNKVLATIQYCIEEFERTRSIERAVDNPADTHPAPPFIKGELGVSEGCDKYSKMKFDKKVY